MSGEPRPVVDRLFADPEDQRWLETTAQTARANAALPMRRRRRAAVLAFMVLVALVVASLVAAWSVTAARR